MYSSIAIPISFSKQGKEIRISKSSSGRFQGTTGSKNSSKYISRKTINNGIIATNKNDIREHPTKYKQMSSKKLRALREKVQNRSITKAEYKRLNWQKRLTDRRNQAIKDFWEKESFLVKNNLPKTRNWNAQQRKDIISGKRPKFRGKTIVSHHTYSVAKYPHLANRKEFIYPATINEHLYGWHGGNTRNSLPGKPIKLIQDF